MSAPSLDELLAREEPLLALAPMQDVTDLPFWRLMTRYGGADVYYTEYFRVHRDYHLEKSILKSVTQNPTGRPAIAQMIGNDIPSLVRTAKELLQHHVAAIDLNLGCPAPIVYRKCAGGGLLRDLSLVDSILGALRDAIPTKFTVKTRIGFEDERPFDELLPLIAKHSIDLLTVHGRTVKQMYRDGVRYDLIARAAAELKCPVLANGNVSSATVAEGILGETRACGLMIGRGAIRNPWIFDQIRQRGRGEKSFVPTGREVLAYVRDLYETLRVEPFREREHVNKMKRYMNFLGDAVEPTGSFLHAMRRATSEAEFFRICEEHLNHDALMPLEPFKLPQPAEQAALSPVSLL